MARVDEIKKSIISEDDVFNGWPEDLDAFGETYPYARKLAGQMLEKGGEEGFADFARGIFSRTDLPTMINTYPFGKPTRVVYPEFLGVCAGRKTLGRMFTVIANQLESYMSPDFDRRAPKAITIFTDEWNPKYLKENEALFLDAFSRYNVSFHFYLVTDYGISRIPFLTRGQAERFRRDFQDEKVEKGLTLQECLEKVGTGEMTYWIAQSDSWIPEPERFNAEYRFNFYDLQCCCENSKGKRHCKKIEENDALQFLKAVLTLQDADGIKSRFSCPSNYVQNVIDLGKIHFDWYENTGVEEHPESARMIECLNRMLR